MEFKTFNSSLINVAVDSNVIIKLSQFELNNINFLKFQHVDPMCETFRRVALPLEYRKARLRSG